MADELISRKALIEQLELLAKHEDSFRQSVILGVVHTIKCAPSVNAVVLPCKVGDTVYGCFPQYSRKVLECKVVKVKMCQFHTGAIRHFVDVEFYIANPYYDDGRLMLHGHQAVVAECFDGWDRVFLTKEEAEKALGERKEENA